jgi:hypothetical protein
VIGATARMARFVIVHVVDRDDWGFDEHSLPRLVAAAEAAGVSEWQMTHASVTAYFLAEEGPRASREVLDRVAAFVTAVEAVRDSDAKCVSIGNGIVWGDLLAEFDRHGGIRHGGLLAGMAHAHAVTAARGPQTYAAALASLRTDG